MFAPYYSRFENWLESALLVLALATYQSAILDGVGRAFFNLDGLSTTVSVGMSALA